jgi:hypothetical protein
MPPRFLGKVEDWLARAEASLALARMTGPGVAVEDLCFQARYASETRYPGGFEPLSPADHAQALELACEVLAWARKQVGMVGPGNPA